MKKITAVGLVCLLGCGSSGSGEKTFTIPQQNNREVHFVNKAGQSYDLGYVVLNDGIAVYPLGRSQYGIMRFEEAGIGTHYRNITMGDAFAVTGLTGVTNLLIFQGANVLTDELVFRDMSDWTEHRIPYIPLDSLQVNGDNFRVYGEFPYTAQSRIAIDQNNDGVLDGRQIPIHTIDGKILSKNDFR